MENPSSIKQRPNPIVRPVNRSKEQLKEFRDIISNPRTSQDQKKGLWLKKQAVIVLCGVI